MAALRAPRTATAARACIATRPLTPRCCRRLALRPAGSAPAHRALACTAAAPRAPRTQAAPHAPLHPGWMPCPWMLVSPNGVLHNVKDDSALRELGKAKSLPFRQLSKLVGLDSAGPPPRKVSRHQPLPPPPSQLLPPSQQRHPCISAAFLATAPPPWAASPGQRHGGGGGSDADGGVAEDSTFESSATCRRASRNYYLLPPPLPSQAR